MQLSCCYTVLSKGTVHVKQNKLFTDVLEGKLASYATYIGYREPDKTARESRMK